LTIPKEFGKKFEKLEPKKKISEPDSGTESVTRSIAAKWNKLGKSGCDRDRCGGWHDNPTACHFYPITKKSKKFENNEITQNGSKTSQKHLKPHKNT